MKEDFVTIEIAKKLKERGFKYNKDYLLDRIFMENQINHPTVSQVLKWLREEKKAHVIVDICKRGWFFNIRCLRTGYVMDGTSLGYSYSFEQASLAAIEFALDNIIKEE